MENKLNFETYLFLGHQKIEISIHDKESFQTLYYEKIQDDNETKVNLNLLSFFLEKNIFKIEKKVKNFIEKTNLIIQSNEFFTLKLSIKKKNYQNVITKNNLIYLLNEAKDECKKTLENKKIIHMIVDNYLVNDQKFSQFPQNMKCDYFSIDVRFICLSIKYINDLEFTLKKYQISIDNILCSAYVDSFKEINQVAPFETSKKLINGLNINEVLIVPKRQKNKGFFERFFDFFS